MLRLGREIFTRNVSGTRYMTYTFSTNIVCKKQKSYIWEERFLQRMRLGDTEGLLELVCPYINCFNN